MKTTNPNNCNLCDHKKRPDGGHCYMTGDWKRVPAEDKVIEVEE